MDRIRLAACAGAACGLGAMCAGSAAQTVYHESEPNNNKAAANGPFVMAPGDMIVGNSTGTSTSATAGSASADYFIVQTVPGPLGIYRHRLTMSESGAGEHIGSIRGYQVNTGNAEFALQTTSAASSPVRPVQWYGFGRSEQVYFRVTGSAGTPDDYTATLSSEEVVPVELGVFPGGLTTITTVGQGRSTDTDLWVYSAELSPIPDFSNDDEPAPGATHQSRLTRDFTGAGVYYLAISAHDLVNDGGPAPDDRVGWPQLLDFAGALLCTSVASAQNVSFAIVDSAGLSHPFAATQQGPFEVVWLKFAVTAPALGACCLADGSCVGGHSAGYCAAQAGVYEGDGTSCDAFACPQPPTGACCFADGSCALVSSYVCAGAGLIWHGAGTDCASAGCVAPACYANCDHSVNPPALNIADFTCFLQQFSSGRPYSNCDASTAPPYLNVSDFLCFLQKFSMGCSAP